METDQDNTNNFTEDRDFDEIQLEGGPSNKNSNNIMKTAADQDVLAQAKSLLTKSRGYQPQYAGVLAAEAMKPTAKELFTVMSNLDLGIKSEIFMYELQSSMFWSSVIELSMFLLGFILFCVVPDLMPFIWMHIPHIIRAIIGFILLKNLPRSHDIIDRLEVTDQHYSFEQIQKLIKENLIKIFMKYTEECNTQLLSYGIVTMFAAFFDFIEFLIQFIRFGRSGDEHSELAMMALTLIFIALDFYYILWAIQAKDKFSPEISKNLTRALFGIASDFIIQMTETLHKNGKNIRNSLASKKGENQAQERQQPVQ
eukprot:403334519